MRKTVVDSLTSPAHGHDRIRSVVEALPDPRGGGAMKHRINPMVDCVGKALLGDDAHPERTVDFLQSILRSDPPIQEVRILNPYNPAEFVGDNHTVVDVKARDAAGRWFQIEVQLEAPSLLPMRMLYGWADLYQTQLAAGSDYTELCPTVSIWLLGNRLIRGSPHWHHHFRAYDPDRRVLLHEHLSIHTIELAKWTRRGAELDIEERWIYFFKEAQHWTELPEELDTPIMRQAMAVLEQFSDKQKDYFLYQARQNYLRDKRTTEKLLSQAREEAARERQEKEQERAAKEQERVAKEQERVAKEHALAENARLREELRRLQAQRGK
jgi:predicted transposase/invertase (TIGR01784 family)